MPNPNKAKGTLFESEVTKALKAEGFDAVKPRQAGAKDIGDIHLERDIVLQAKAWRDVPSALREGTAGAQVQAGHAGRPFGFAVIKKPRAAILDAYVVIPLRGFMAFLKTRNPD